MQLKAITGNPVKIRTGALIVTHFEGDKTPTGDAAVLDKALGGLISRLVREGDIKGKNGEITVVHATDAIYAGRVVICGMGKKRAATLDKIRQNVAGACRYLAGKDLTSIAVAVRSTGIKGITEPSVIETVTEAVILGLYSFKRYRTKKDNSTEITKVKIVGRSRTGMPEAIERGTIVAEAVNWTRDLVNEPANHMTPTHLAEATLAMAKTHGLKIEVFDRDKIAEMGMGGLIGVSQGSQQPPKFMVLNYKGTKSDKIDIALVGKGITFDSGGISIKPSENMADMKGDMAGAASVLGTMVAVARLKPSVNVTAIVPATENLPSGSALKPGDIITALNGKTMEILNTDAEGRLILADALSYAVKLGSRKIVDVATLTGACQIALGNICTGAFGNNQPFMNNLLDAGDEAGEYVWQMPMFPEYTELIQSTIADIKNTGGRYGGAITAAKFLEEFVGRTPWVHLDIAGTSDTDKDKGYNIKGATGVPVRTLINLVKNMSRKIS